MIERIVENWLTSVKERSYQIPFSQILLLEGYTVVHVSKHGPMEQGKDIIARSPDGVPCAYQLKSGDINLDTWREIKSQIDELVEVPIAHPSIDKGIPFRAYLVTNGEMSDPVRILIAERNAYWEGKGLSRLNVILKGDLLRKFTDAYNSFFPGTPQALRDFLELYLADGRDFVDKGKLAAFLYGLLLEDSDVAVNDSNKLRDRAASAALITQSLLTSFEREKNHVAIVESWIMFCADLLALAEKARILSKFWHPTYEVVIKRVCEQLDDLKAEFLSRKRYLEQPTLGDGGVVYKARLMIVLGWLCAYELFRLARSPTGWKCDERLLEIVQQNYERWSWYGGESITPHLIMVSLLTDAAGDASLSWNILLKMIVEICEKNSNESENGFPDPYTPLHHVIEAQMPGQQDLSDNKHPPGFSYHLAPLVYHAARRAKRTALNELWKAISKITMREYHPTHNWHYLLWISRMGKDDWGRFERTQSWAKLQEVATSSASTLPTIVQDNPEFLYYFLLVYPHRLTSEALRTVDEMTTSSAKTAASRDH